MKRWFFRIVAGLGGMVVLLTLAAVVYLWSFTFSVPSYDGTLKTAGLAEPVQILRDRYGVPHILAPSSCGR